MNYKNTNSFTLLIALFVFIQNPKESQAQQTLTNTITHDNLERQYILYVPENYTGDTPVPLVFNFHGYGSNATEQLNYGDFRPLADQYGFLVAHPQGTVDSNGSTHFNVGWRTSTVDDVGFTEAMINEISSKYTIDSKRIYSTGMSNGGFMSYKLACELSDKIAAIASVTGTMTVGQQNDCTLSHPVPILEIHGTNDTTVPYEGNFGFESIENVLDFWVSEVNATATPEIISIENTATDDNSTVEYYVYPNGDNGTQIEHFKIINGGHTWPGSQFEIGPVTNKDIDASEEIWNFFSQYDIDGRIEVLSVNDLDAKKSDLNIYPNPTTSFLTIENNFSTPENYSLHSIDGKLIKKGTIDAVHNSLQLSDISSGVYFLGIQNSSYQIIKTE